MSPMSEQTTPPRGRLREHVAEEIRVLLARRKMSGAELARRTGIKQSTMSRRMTAETAFDMDDLEAIANVLDIQIGDLFPRQDGRSNQNFDPAPTERLVTVGQAIAGMAKRGTCVPPPRTTPHPFSQPKPGPKRPPATVPPRKRRPAPIRRTNG